MQNRLGPLALAALAGLGLALVTLTTTHAPAARAAGPWYVATTGAAINDCLAVATPCETIQRALDLASPGDTIYVGAGSYTGAGPNVITVTQGVILSGGWNPGFTSQTGTSVIDSQNARRGVQITSGAPTTIISFTISNGLVTTGAITSGAAIYADAGSPLTLSDTTIQNNSAEGSGGAIYSASNVVLTRTILSNNACTAVNCFGGALHVGGSGVLNALDSQFLNNSAYFSGGAFANNDVTLQGGRFEGNTCSGSNCFGAGLNTHRSIQITGTQFINNSGAERGGGLDVFDNAVIVNAVFSDNSATGYGGAMFVDGDLTLTDSSIIDNSSAFEGGGIYVFGNATLTRAVISRNVSNRGGGGQIGGNLSATGGTLSGNVAQATDGGGLIVGDTATFSAVTILTNTAATDGGALASTGLTRVALFLDNNIFGGNTASSGAADIALRATAGTTLIGRHNTFASPTAGVGLSLEAGAIAVSDVVTLTNTIYDGYSTGVSVEAVTATARVDGVLWSGVTLPTSGNATVTGAVTGAADFIAPGSHNYHINATSAGFNQGVVTGLTTDIDGEARVIFGLPDLGADEVPTGTNLTLTKTATPALAGPGTSVTFTLQYTNTGSTTASGVTITDLVDANVYTGMSFTSSGASLTPTGGTPYVWNVADLAPGAGGTITISAQVRSSVSDGTAINTATIATSSNDLNPADNTGSASIQVMAGITGLSVQTNSPQMPGLPVAFTATVTTGSSVNFAWDFGDGATGSGANPSHAYVAVGSYTATVTASNPVSSAVLTVPVSINNEPITGLALNGPTTALILSPTAFSATVTAGASVSYVWQIDGVPVATGATPLLTFTTLGSHTVTVIATNPANSQTVSRDVTVTPIRLLFPLISR